MTVDFVELDVDTVKSMFYFEDGELYRRSSNGRFDGMYVDDQRTVRVGNDRPTVNRVKYILLHNKLPEGEVLMNDLGELVDTADNHLRMVIALRDSDRVREYDTGRYVGRYIDRSGVRRGKAFSTYREAIEFSRSMTVKVWGEYAGRLGFKL